MKDMSPNTDSTRLYPAQKLTETWRIEFSCRAPGKGVEARLMEWPSVTNYLCVGRGESVKEARYDLVVKLAKEILDDATTDAEREEGLALAAAAALAAMESDALPSSRLCSKEDNDG
jgi:hypothetical protein